MVLVMVLVLARVMALVLVLVMVLVHTLVLVVALMVVVAAVVVEALLVCYVAWRPESMLKGPRTAPVLTSLRTGLIWRGGWWRVGGVRWVLEYVSDPRMYRRLLWTN